MPNITVGSNGIYAGGGVLGDAMAYPLSDADGDGIWEATISLADGTSGNYIFLNSPSNGGDWGAKEDLTGLPCADPANWNDRILPAVTAVLQFTLLFWNFMLVVQHLQDVIITLLWLTVMVMVGTEVLLMFLLVVV